MNELEYWMMKACQLAEKAAARDEVPVGALLVLNGAVLAEGSNERESTNRTAAHAEMVAIENFNAQHRTWRVPPGTSIFVTSEPCLMCSGALLWARVDNLYYGCNDTKDASYRRIAPLADAGIFDHRFKKVEGGIAKNQCGALLTDYFQRKRDERRNRE